MNPLPSSQLATVVISVPVREERHEDYQRVQDQLSAAVKTFAGFRATEVLPPVPGAQDDWVIIYRFDSSEHLQAWLKSDQRATLVKQLEPLLKSPASEQIIIGRGQSTEATAVFAHHLRPGCEDTYRAWRRKMQAAQQKSPGYLGLESFDPVPGSHDEWVDIVRYTSPEALNCWLNSPERAALMRELDALVDKLTIHRLGSGLEGWFHLRADTAAPPPPAWKQGLTVLFALYPTVMVFTLYIMPHLPVQSLAAQLLIGNILSVAFLNWVCMPPLNRVLQNWLASGPKSTAGEYGTTAGLIAGLGLFFSLFYYLSA